jgi:hypothetical protein
LRLQEARNHRKTNLKSLPILRERQKQERLQKDFQGIKSSKEEVGGRNHHI